MDVKNRKAEQSEATRRALLDAARELFAERGYAGTATEEIVQRTGVTRGALYHQFRDKKDLFRAVYEEVEHDLTARIAAELQSQIDPRSDAWQQVRAGAHAYLDACSPHDVQRIALLEAPSVLGWRASREVSRFGLHRIRQGLQLAIEQGLMEPPVEPFAHLLRAAFMEAAMLVARADDQVAARVEVGAAIDRLIAGLGRTSPCAPGAEPEGSSSSSA